MKPFNIELAKAGYPVCTRNGRKARIICFDVKGNVHPIIALVEECGHETTMYYNKRGESCASSNKYDLMMATEKKTGWINIANNGEPYVYYAKIYPTEMEAVADVLDVKDYIITTQIEWEE